MNAKRTNELQRSPPKDSTTSPRHIPQWCPETSPRHIPQWFPETSPRHISQWCPETSPLRWRPVGEGHVWHTNIELALNKSVMIVYLMCQTSEPWLFKLTEHRVWRTFQANKPSAASASSLNLQTWWTWHASIAWCRNINGCDVCLRLAFTLHGGVFSVHPPLLPTLLLNYPSFPYKKKSVQFREVHFYIVCMISYNVLTHIIIAFHIQ